MDIPRENLMAVVIAMQEATRTDLPLTTAVVDTTLDTTETLLTTTPTPLTTHPTPPTTLVNATTTTVPQTTSKTDLVVISISAP